MRKIRALALAAWTVGAPWALPQSAAQGPIVGEINFYGLRKISQEHILGVLKLHPGDRLHGSKADMEDRLAEISGVVLARVVAVCCEGPRVTLFIGLEQRIVGQLDATHPAFRSAPAGNAVLPAELVEAYSGFLEAVARAAAQGHAREDLSAGYSMMDDPEAWAFQKRFLEMAPDNAALLREVLRNGSEPGQRAIAAALIGYAPDKKTTIDDLQYALQDPDEAVRANALRSLTAIAVLASRLPLADARASDRSRDREGAVVDSLRISPTWMVELLNSVVLTDRVESVKALTALTDAECPGKQSALELVRERALPAVLEMARWKTPGDALPPFLLAGRLAGMTYVDILQAWATGDREAVLAKALGTGRKKPGGTLQ